MINEEIINMIRELTVLDGNEDIKETDALIDLGIDSMKLVELIVNIEIHYEIEFSDTELSPSELITVEDIIKLVGSYVR